MSGTDPTTPHPTETAAPVPPPPAPPVAVPPARRTAPAVPVGGSAQAAPDDAPTSLMPALATQPPSSTQDRADATRVAAPLRPVPGAPDPTSHPAPTPSTAPAAAPVPTRTPSYSARRAPATPPAGPYGGLYADPLGVQGGTVPPPDEQPDAEATRVAGPLPVPPAPAAATQPPAPPTAEPQPAPAAAPRTPPARATAMTRRAEPRVVVLGGVVGVLVVVAVVLGFTLFGGSGSPAATPSAAATSDTGKNTEPVVTERFAAPSRNITCSMTATEARCAIAELAKKPAPVDGCDGTVGYVVTLNAEGKVDTPCVAPADQPKAASSGTEPLAYGKSVRMGKLVCSSSETGVECRSKGTGGGFTIARAGIRTL